MYPYILACHSLVRWLVVFSLMCSLYRAFRGWLYRRPFSKFDNTVRHTTATIVHVQLIIGLWLYLISPIINYFLHSYQEAVHQRQIRFFGMEHSLMMLISIIIITIGSAKAKRETTDQSKFKTMAVWYSIGLMIIIITIPWPFSPFGTRPYLRWF